MEPNPKPPQLGFSEPPDAWPKLRLSKRQWIAIGVAGLLAITGVAATAYYFSRDEGPTDYIEVYLTDAPANLTRLLVRISGVFVGAANHSLHVEQPSFDLLTLRGPQDALRVASGRVPSADHREVRIVFQSVRAEINGVQVDLDIPDRVLVIGHDFGLSQSRSSAILFDINVDQSLQPREAGMQFRPHVDAVYIHQYDRPQPGAASPGASQPASQGGPKPGFENESAKAPERQQLDQPRANLAPAGPFESPAPSSGKPRFQWSPANEQPQPSPSPSGSPSASPSPSSRPPESSIPLEQALPSPGSANSVPREKGSIGGWFVQFYKETIKPDEMAAIVESFNGQVLFVFGSVPAAYIFATAEEAERLAQDDAVRYVEADQPVTPHVASSRIAIRLPQVQDPVSGLRDGQGRLLEGQGISIAAVDIGFDGTHPDLPYRLLNPANPLLVANYKVESLFTIDLPTTDQTSGHGTHVLGIMSGRGVADPTQKGVAPQARVYGLGIGELRTTLWPATAYDWIVQNHNRVDPPIRIVQNSWGSGTQYDPNALVTRLIERLVSEGVVVVFSAGNEFGDGSSAKTSSQCQIPVEGVICVGAYDDQNSGTRSGTLPSYSSRGAIAQPTTWPDLVAPGSSIRSTRPLLGSETGLIGITPYWETSGTSMAAPHVSGVIALMLQARPGLTPAQVESILEASAHAFDDGGAYFGSPDARYNGSHFAKGHGLLDAWAAVQMARSS